MANSTLELVYDARIFFFNKSMSLPKLGLNISKIKITSKNKIGLPLVEVPRCRAWDKTFSAFERQPQEVSMRESGLCIIAKDSHHACLLPGPAHYSCDWWSLVSVQPSPHLDLSRLCNCPHRQLWQNCPSGTSELRLAASIYFFSAEESCHPAGRQLGLDHRQWNTPGKGGHVEQHRGVVALLAQRGDQLNTAERWPWPTPSGPENHLAESCSDSWPTESREIIHNCYKPLCLGEGGSLHSNRWLKEINTRCIINKQVPVWDLWEIVSNSLRVVSQPSPASRERRVLVRKLS